MAPSASGTMPLRRASCIVLLRKNKAHQGLEVLMAQRSKNLKAFAGAYVFPGGVSEPCDGPEGTQEQSKRCGLRELFEEAGVLLAMSARGNRAKPVEFKSREEKKAWQKRVHDNPNEFEKLLKEKNVNLATNALFHWVTFITPVMEPRRFYTDFFVVDSRYEDEGLELDEGETISLSWIAPEEALEKNIKGEMPFLPPQFYVLRTILAAGKSPAEVVASVAERKPEDAPVPILPHPVGMQDKILVLAYPGDEEHCDYPGPKGSKHRIMVRTPMGSSGGYRFDSTLKGPALTAGEWAAIKSKAAL